MASTELKIGRAPVLAGGHSGRPRVAKAAGAARMAFCHYSLSPDVDAFVVKAKPVAKRIGYSGEIIGPTEGTVLAI